MVLSKELRSEIADSIIRTAVPVAFFGMIINVIGIILFGGQQYHRLIPTMTAIIFLIPPWVFTRKGKPLTGIIFVVPCICMGILSGMVVSGGIHALAYTASLVVITVIIVFYGARGGIVFVISTLTMGGLFSMLIRHGVLPRVDEPTTAHLFLLHAILLIMQFFFVLIPVRLMYRALKDSQRQSTELQKAVIERKLARDELLSILNNTPDIIYRLDPEGKITFISEAVRKYGTSPESLIGHSIMDLIHPDYKPDIQQRMLERSEGKRGTDEIEVKLSIPNPDSCKTTEHRIDKTWIPFHITSDGLYPKDAASSESFIGTQGIARDISRIRHFEQQVGRLAAVVEQAAEDVIITDQEGVIQYVNPRFVEVTGYSPSEVIGKTPRIFKSGKHDTAFYEELWKTITNGEIWKGHIWNKVKNGSIILQDVTITPIFDVEGKLSGYASARRDITERNRMQEQLQQAQKLNAIGTLAGGIAHDFNNILSGIIGYTELALYEVGDRPFTKDKLERVLAAGSRATELVKQILSFSRSHKSEIKPISPVGITNEVIKLMRASLPSTIEIRQAINSNGYILADSTNIHQVLMNLCTNAAYAMKQKGGVLSINLQDVTLGSYDLSHRPGLQPGEYLKISVADTGTGMTKDVQEKAFDPFFTTKESGEGTGMGLSTIHGIITGLHGFISLYSEPGQGTAIHVYIPLIPMPAEIDVQAAEQSLKGGTERILFVDDEQIQVDLAKDALVRYGYQVTAFSDSTMALAHFQQNPYEYDLVITDMTMPKMTGDILIQKIRLKRLDIPVIMCTGFSEVMDEHKAKALGIHAFLYKPVVLKNMLETIRKAIDSER